MGDLIIPEQWIERVIQALWQMDVIDSWNHRNEELYGKTEGEQMKRMVAEVDSQIRVLCLI